MSADPAALPPLTPLQQRLEFVARHPGRDWTVLLENVPTWPVAPEDDPGGAAAPGEAGGGAAVPDAAGDPGAAGTAWHYPASQGLPALLSEVTRREHTLGRSACTPENLLVTHGALHAIGLILRHLRAQGCHTVLCQAPLLGSIATLVRASGLRLLLAPAAGLAAALAALPPGRPAAVLVNTPHNPTGEVLGEPLLRHLAGATGDRPLWLIVDRVYDGYDFTRAQPGEPDPVPVRRGVLAVNSMSKNYGAPGLRVGWVVGDPATIRALTVRLEYESIAVSGPSQRQAGRLIRSGNAPLVERVRGNRRLLAQWWHGSGLAGSGLPGGGTHAWLPLPAGVDADAFADRLLDDSGVVLLSSSSFEGAGGPHLRVPLGTGPELLAAGLAGVAAGLRRHASTSTAGV
jgi:L-arginine:2-oxoglutarate/L-aspartate:5-guanidino-3-methyl-2-oxopentanoate transaminase